MCEMVLVTAADKKFFVSAISLLESLKRNSESTSAIIYNLGLSKRQEAWIKKVMPSNFKLSDLPKVTQEFEGWDDLGASGNFAWKPIILREIALKHDEFVWADAGTLVTRSLEDLQSALNENGVFLLRNYDHINADWTSKDCQVIMKTTERELSSPHLMGNFFGVSQKNVLGRKLFNEWIKWAKVPNAIQGNRLVHRHDQTILSIIAARVEAKVFDPNGLTSIGRFKRDYHDAIESRNYFVAHRRWLGLIPINLISKRTRHVFFYLPYFARHLIRSFAWRMKWRLRWCFIVRKLYEFRSSKK